jgi:hypothetical protein
MAGARMKIVLNGREGSERSGIWIGASNDSSWARESASLQDTGRKQKMCSV